MDDLRGWLDKADKSGIVKRLEDVDWNLDMGVITTLNVHQDSWRSVYNI